MQAVANRSSYPFLCLAYLCAVVVGAVATVLAQSHQSGFSGADEPAHFLNGWFVAEYLAHHFGSNPLAAATDYYVHYPKLSIGHWPPAYYGVLGLLFLVVPPSLPAVFAINVLVAALPAIGVAFALVLLAGRRAALAGVLVYALAPLVLEGHVMFMADQPLAACLVAATAAWIAFAVRPTWGRALGFAALAALAVLIKGNGWLVVFVPVLHILLTANWHLLRSAKLYTAAALALLLCVPWYLLTAGIAADGFNYQAGLPYAGKALAANLLTLARNLTLAGAVLALVAIVAEFRARGQSPLRWSIVAGAVSLLLATLALQSLVPVDIVDRYMAPALPALAVLAVLGGTRVMAGLRQDTVAPAMLGIAFAVIMAVPGLLHLVQRTPKADTGLPAIAGRLAAGGQPGATVIDGASSHEGSFIAGMAVHDRALEGYVVRASKLLADSNFMGSRYALKHGDPALVLADLRRLGIGHVVIVREGGQPAFPHSVQLRAAVAGSGSGFRLAERIAHRYRPGVTEVYQATGAARPNVAALRGIGLPAKAASLTQP